MVSASIDDMRDCEANICQFLIPRAILFTLLFQLTSFSFLIIFCVWLGVEALRSILLEAIQVVSKTRISDRNNFMDDTTALFCPPAMAYAWRRQQMRFGYPEELSSEKWLKKMVAFSMGSRTNFSEKASETTS